MLFNLDLIATARKSGELKAAEIQRKIGPARNTSQSQIADHSGDRSDAVTSPTARQTATDLTAVPPNSFFPFQSTLNPVRSILCSVSGADFYISEYVKQRLPVVES